MHTCWIAGSKSNSRNKATQPNMCCASHNRLAFKTEDLIKYFKLESEQKLPQIEELEDMAKRLHCAYSSTKGYYEALYGLQEPGNCGG
jgi:hypothetical protein